MCILAAATALAVLLAQAPAGAGAPPEIIDLGPSLTFADARTAERFKAYLALLLSDPVKHRREIETVRGLGASEVTFVVALVGRLPPDTGGRLSSDGERILVSVLDDERQDGSLDSRLAHELEHARQFDAGELGFMYDEAAGAWRPMMSSYDIGDEVLAWEAQLRTAASSDFWTRDGERVAPTVLKLFAGARTFEERARLLRSRGYADRNPLAFSNVAFPRELGHAGGELVRTGGRVFARNHTPGGEGGPQSLGRASSVTSSRGVGRMRGETAGVAWGLRWAAHAPPPSLPSSLP